MAEAAENRVLSVGVHGIGGHARRILLPAIDACPAVRLAGISTRDATVRDAVAKEWNCPAWDNLDAMLADADLDAVLVSTPIGRHFEDGMKVLAAGVHLWAEKAFTRTLDEARSLHAAAEAADLGICVSMGPAYHGLFHAVRKLLADGAIGRVRDIAGCFGFPHVERSRTLYDSALGGSALLDIGYYPLLLPALLLGETPDIIGARMAGDDGYDIDTEGAALLTFPSGAQATALWGYGRDYINEMTIIGETGTIHATPVYSKPAHLPVRLRLRRQNAFEDVPVGACNQFADMLGCFAAAADDDAARRSLRDTALAHQTILADVARRAGRPNE